jgi:hypothetical protein
MPILSAFGAARAIGGPVAGSSGIQQGEYSYSFNGSTSVVSYPTNAAFTAGSNSLTVEFWVYITANPGSGSGNRYAILSLGDDNLGSAGAWGIGIDNAGKVNWRRVTSGAVYTNINSSASVTLSAWNFVAVSRSGNTIYIFIGGTQYAATGMSNTLPLTRAPIIGRCGSTNFLNGSISNIKYRIGVGITSSTVPATPLQNDADTKLLTCRNSTIVDNSTANSGSAWTITSSQVTVQASSPYYP